MLAVMDLTPLESIQMIQERIGLERKLSSNEMIVLLQIARGWSPNLLDAVNLKFELHAVVFLLAIRYDNGRAISHCFKVNPAYTLLFLPEAVRIVIECRQYGSWFTLMSIMRKETLDAINVAATTEKNSEFLRALERWDFVKKSAPLPQNSEPLPQNSAPLHPIKKWLKLVVSAK